MKDARAWWRRACLDARDVYEATRRRGYAPATAAMSAAYAVVERYGWDGVLLATDGAGIALSDAASIGEHRAALRAALRAELLSWPA